MPRRRRRIISNTCYEICFRARATLPFVAYLIIKLIIGAAIARTQRDNKVILCHDIWNGSHPHIIIVAKDSQQCVNFYSEIQKKITDALKRLVGLNHLQIWEGFPMVAEIADLDAAKERISYLYANPAQDNLVDSIEKFPGYSSWEDFNKCFNFLKAESKKVFPWIRLPSIPKLISPCLSSTQDSNFVRLVTRRNKEKHLLVRKPNQWMSCFGIETDADVENINKDIVRRIREREELSRLKRKVENKPLMGISKLCSQPILKFHVSKKKERKIFLLSSIRKLRVQLIKEFQEFCILCRECYLDWMSGKINVEWPPGAFRPPLPPLVNLLPIRT
ncbi:MAG: hypothetical protein SGJ02_04355 [bacterium]|nr:hypothetical protein [bacterium]